MGDLRNLTRRPAKSALGRGRVEVLARRAGGGVGNEPSEKSKRCGTVALAPLLSLPHKKIAIPRTNSPMSHCRHRDAKPPGKVPFGGTSAMRRPTVLLPLDRTMQLLLTVAGRLQTTFADVVSSPLPGRLAALVSRLQADRNERSGEERKWGVQ